MSDENVWDQVPVNDLDSIPANLDSPPRPGVEEADPPIVTSTVEQAGVPSPGFPRLFTSDRFSVERLYSVVIPGIPDPPETILGRAEQDGREMIALTSHEINQTIFFRHKRWIRQTLTEVGYPDPGDPIFGFDNPGDGNNYFRWPLPQVERMCLYLKSLDRISDDHFIMSRQVIAWIARGYDLYEG